MPLLKKLVTVALLLPCLQMAKAQPVLPNPVLDKDFADPTVIRVNDTYYAYATQGSYQGKTLNIQVASSKNLLHWQVIGDALPVKPIWASQTQDFWAPHVLYDSGLHQYVMFFSGKNNDTAYDKCIGVAFAAQPEGPFTATGSPLLLNTGFTEIDPMAIIDPESRKKLLYWGSGFKPIRVREMNEDWQSFKEGTLAKPVLLPGGEKKYTKLIEGGWVDYDSGWYYLYYSGDNCCGPRASYAVLVARAKNAFGPFETMGQATGSGSSVLLEKDSNWLAPGHNSVVKDAAGNKWIAYHAIRAGQQKKGMPAGGEKHTERVMLISHLEYRNGWPVAVKK